MPMESEVDKPISEEVIRRKKLRKWTSIRGIYKCPKCSSINIAHLTVANEGEKLICSMCKYEEIVAKEERKIRRGLIV